MFNNLRFTDNVDLVIQNAGSIALQYGSYAIDTEHILYGLTIIGDSVASKILSKYGITSESLITLFSKLFRGSSTIISRNVDVSLDAKEYNLYNIIYARISFTISPIAPKLASISPASLSCVLHLTRL